MKARKSLPYIAAALVMGAAAVALYAMGRVPVCACGQWWTISTDVFSPHNSQHLIDPYTITHILHGVMFYGLTWLLFRRGSVAVRLSMAVAMESMWEVIENSDMVIHKFRATTMALNYFGDSIVNSMADIAACAAGFGLASQLAPRYSWGFFICMEILLILTIRDSLIINIVMLLHPIPALRDWQLSP